MKICIFGLPGAGKSYAALELAQHFGIPLHHLDQIFYTNDWQERPAAEFVKQHLAILETPSWVMDGNCMKQLEARFAKSDIAIYINLPKLFCLKRLIDKRLSVKPQIEKLPKGCKKRLPWKLVRFMWNFNKRFGFKIAQLHQRYPNVKYFEVCDKKSAEDLLKHLKK
ncbi:MAG: hypothetical protein JHC93_07620 [Parachlamydiales bacterium]|nr:hypothetical protein [Parachlamydiales bacterium]